MKVLIILFFIIFCFQPWTKADDIRDFEIEGFTIGGNLLDHFNRTKIQSEKFFFEGQKDNKKYASIKIYEELKNFKSLTINFIDKSYKIGSMSAFVNIQNITECRNQRKVIIEEIKSLFIDTDLEEFDKPHFLDKNSIVETTLWTLKNGFVRVACYNWSKDSGYPIELRIDTASTDYANFLNSL